MAGDGNGNLRKLIIDIISGIRHSILQIEFSFAIGFNLGNQTTLKWNCWTLPLLVLVAGISHGKYQWLATVTYQCLATVADGISAWQILSGVRLNSSSVMDSQMQDLVIKSEVWHGSLQIQRCSSIGITDPGSSLIKYFIHSTISCVHWSDPHRLLAPAQSAPKLGHFSHQVPHGSGTVRQLAETGRDGLQSDSASCLTVPGPWGTCWTKCPNFRALRARASKSGGGYGCTGCTPYGYALRCWGQTIARMKSLNG